MSSILYNCKNDSKMIPNWFPSKVGGIDISVLGVALECDMARFPLLVLFRASLHGGYKTKLS